MTFDPSRRAWIGRGAVLLGIAPVFSALAQLDPVDAPLIRVEPPPPKPEPLPAPVIDEAKLIAQQASLPYLSGERPFILREMSWSGSINPGQARLIQVQLFKRNDYHFWFATPNRRALLNLNLYDSQGELVEAEYFEHRGKNIVSLIATPKETGIYYLRLALQPSVEDAQQWSVIYAYR